MVKYSVKGNATGQYYVPKAVREELGPELVMLCGAKAAVLFAPDQPLDVVITSLEILVQDLKNRMRIEGTRNGYVQR